MNLACSSLDAWPGPASDRASFSGSSPIHSSSVSASSESIAPESCNRRGASTPGGAGVVVGSGVGGLAGVALGAAVGLSFGAWVETGASVDAGAAVPDDTWVGVGTSSVAGVVSEQAVRVANATRRVRNYPVSLTAFAVLSRESIQRIRTPLKGAKATPVPKRLRWA